LVDFSAQPPIESVAAAALPGRLNLVSRLRPEQRVWRADQRTTAGEPRV
jgi:hypothetical protein